MSEKNSELRRRVNASDDAMQTNAEDENQTAEAEDEPEITPDEFTKLDQDQSKPTGMN